MEEGPPIFVEGKRNVTWTFNSVLCCVFVCFSTSRTSRVLRVREHKVLGPYVDGLSRLAVSSYKVIPQPFLVDSAGVIFIVWAIRVKVVLLFSGHWVSDVRGQQVTHSGLHQHERGEQPLTRCLQRRPHTHDVGPAVWGETQVYTHYLTVMCSVLIKR